MPHWIMIFNQQPLRRFDEKTLLTALTAAHFSTLCDQYGLDPALIGPALDHLAVEMPVGSQVPFFLLRYQPKDQPPIVVTEWDAAVILGEQGLQGVIREHVPAGVRQHFLSTRAVYSLELDEGQLANMGLLLAYEFARWAAGRGSGIVRGLDGVWYRLNRHHAFIHLASEST